MAATEKWWELDELVDIGEASADDTQMLNGNAPASNGSPQVDPSIQNNQVTELLALNALARGEDIDNKGLLDSLVSQGYVRKTKRRFWVKPKGNRRRKKLSKLLDHSLVEELRMAQSV